MNKLDLLKVRKNVLEERHKKIIDIKPKHRDDMDEEYKEKLEHGIEVTRATIAIIESRIKYNEDVIFELNRSLIKITNTLKDALVIRNKYKDVSEFLDKILTEDYNTSYFAAVLTYLNLVENITISGYVSSNDIIHKILMENVYTCEIKENTFKICIYENPDEIHEQHTMVIIYKKDNEYRINTYDDYIDDIVPDDERSIDLDEDVSSEQEETKVERIKYIFPIILFDIIIPIVIGIILYILTDQKYIVVSYLFATLYEYIAVYLTDWRG